MGNDDPGKQKSPPGKTDELVNIVNLKSQAINLTYLSASRRMELAPFQLCHPGFKKE
jgi:hypothetical protein